LFGRALRFLFALPVALVATVGLYYFWFSSFLNQECDGCGGDQMRVAEAPSSWQDWTETIRIICGGWFSTPESPDPSNSYTRRDKASPTAPEPVECGEGCDPSRISLEQISILDDGSSISSSSKTDLIVEVRPVFPKGCPASFRSGRAVVEFDVSPEGAVMNARVVSSTDACLDAAALKNISRMRYAPQTDASGRATWRRGDQVVITFELAE